ncbi:DUF881 domain-containing protein [Desulfosporosinus sp. FKA]|uniref:DUF881 domain-containing protein n=1 Tax=Desulfosporosinus sp. FKA TaxID=1969834 RepID=UPI000B49C9C4|nr:DUF881 domain-containing protein [Desulfosporosinus sp. FKA]
MQLEIRERSLLGLGSVLIGFLFVMLLKAHGIAGNDPLGQETAVPNLVQTELENQQISVENDKLRQELAKYAQGQSASTLANQQLQDAEMNSGLIAVSGPGLRITLDDSKRTVQGQDDLNNYYIHEQYIREIFNALWNGGAEAIAVNGQRVTTNTEVFCGGSFIQINGTRQMPPYVIEAIGDKTNLTAALKFYGWDRLGDFQQQYGITRKLEIEQNLTLPAGKLKPYRFAQPVKEGT